MQSQNLDTEELLCRANQGDGDAQHALYARFRTRLTHMIRARMDPRLHARIDPSDIVQETLTAANSKMQDFMAERPLPFYPWLRQIAWEKLVHEHDRHLRAAKRSVAREQKYCSNVSDASLTNLAERFTSPHSSPSQGLISREVKQRVEAGLASLNETDREVLLMRYLEQMPSKEIAAILGISEAAVNMRHMRALQRMRERLGNQ